MTLGVRMDRHCDNAEKVVEFLAGDEAVRQVIYPGLSEHPGHEVASRQMKRYGGIVSFRVTGGEQHALDVCAKAEVFTLAGSLGGIESLIEHPGRMTHASAAGTDLEVPNDLIRLSVGIETADDLLADLDRALGSGQDPGRQVHPGQRRTLLAYQRSAIGLMAAAIAIGHFFGDDLLVVAMALVLLGTGAFAAVGGYLRYRQVDAALRAGRPIGSGSASSPGQRGGADLPGARGGLRHHAGGLSMPASAVVCVDVGSTFTKAALVSVDGALLATASHRTTLDTDVLDGIDACRASLRHPVGRGRRGAGVLVGRWRPADRWSATRSWSPPRLVAGSRSRAGQGRRGARSALGSSLPLVGAESRPDVVLLTGGTDGGDEEGTCSAPRRLSASGWRDRSSSPATSQLGRRSRPCWTVGRSWSRTTWCRGSAYSLPSRRAAPSARCSSST